MAHEQVVQSPPRPRHFPQCGPQQVVPQPPLHPHRLARRVPVVQRPQPADVLLVMRIARTEVLLDALPVAQRNVPTGDQRPVPQPVAQAPPAAILGVQREAIRRRRLDGPGAGPAQQPIPAVRQDAHARPLAVPLRLIEVVIKLLDVPRVGTEAGPRANPPLDLDERIQRRQVHRAPRRLRRRVLLHDLVCSRQPRADQEVPHRAGDVRLRLGMLMPPQNLPRQLIQRRLTHAPLPHHHHSPPTDPAAPGLVIPAPAGIQACRRPPCRGVPRQRPSRSPAPSSLRRKPQSIPHSVLSVCSVANDPSAQPAPQAVVFPPPPANIPP